MTKGYGVLTKIDIRHKNHIVEILVVLSNSICFFPTTEAIIWQEEKSIPFYRRRKYLFEMDGQRDRQIDRWI